MTSTAGMVGRRLPDDGFTFHSMKPGDYGRLRGHWAICTPVEGAGWPLDGRWTVFEHEDGTITVNPSIHEIGIWHGWLKRGIWEGAAQA